MSRSEQNKTQNDSDHNDLAEFNLIRDGDMDAMSRLFKQNYKPLYYFAAKFVRNPDIAENMVQDVFLKVWSGREELQIKHSVKSLLYTMTRNQSLNYLKRNKIVPLTEENLTKSSYLTGSAEENYIEKEMHESIYQAINKLPHQCRQVFLMKRYDNLKYTEISEVLNISINSVKTQMKRALKFLLKHLKNLT